MSGINSIYLWVPGFDAPTTSKFIDYDALKIEIKNSIYCKLNLNSDDDPNTNYNILESTLVTAIKNTQ